MIGVKEAGELAAAPSAIQGNVQAHCPTDATQRCQCEMVDRAGLEPGYLALTDTGLIGDIGLAPAAPVPERPGDVAELQVTHRTTVANARVPTT